jgi:hypothetical protein
MMKIRPAFLAGPSLALAVALALGACTPTSKVAEPDIVMKSAVIPQVLAPCLAYKLGQQFRDHRPSVDYYRGVHEIAIDSPRGEKLAFVTVESDRAGGSVVSFWNGDLYWPDHTVSGVWPDVMRDNWHRFENAENACQPGPVAAKPVAKMKSSPRPAPVVAKPTKTVTKAEPLKPLAATSSAKAPAATSAPATLAPPKAHGAAPTKAPMPISPPPPQTTPSIPPAAAVDPALLGS